MRPRLAVRRLTMTNFRNYDSALVSVDHRPVVLTGANGAGKTNLLEALSFLVPGRGLRRAAIDAVARRGGPETWSVAAALDGAEGPVELGTGLVAPVDEAGRRRAVPHRRGGCRLAGRARAARGDELAHPGDGPAVRCRRSERPRSGGASSTAW